MRNILIFSLLVSLVGCAAFSRTYEEQDIVKFTYNDELSFEFKIPSNGTDINPNNINVKFYPEDLEKNSQNVLWILNKTYEQVRTRTYSGKYSVRVAAFSVANNDEVNLKDISDLEKMELNYYKKEFNIDASFDKKLISGNYWLWEENSNQGNNSISASFILNENVYLAFVFEYLGKDDEELRVLSEITNRTLTSFKLSKAKVNKALKQDADKDSAS